ncbi:MAG: VCBS repeat-containing protein, partial [Planctomycetota bacterium]|nr:VCBS repeat-containing protein [Planctomycetota bacterium]
IVDRDRKLDVSFSAHAVDLNLDRRVDCIIFTGDQRAKDVRTQVQVFLQGTRGKDSNSPLFGTEGLPDQLLVLKGFAGNPRFDDVDGNGYPDLLVGTLRPDLIDTLRAAGGKHVRAELHVFLNRDGRFGRRPDLTYRTNVQASSLRVRRPVLMARFFGDVTGDGVSDLLLRDEADSLKVLMTRRTRKGLSIHSRALWTLTIDRHATVRLPAARRGRTPEILVLERSQILRVRFE